MHFADYAARYTGIHFARDGAGVLTMTLHTRGSEALWGTYTRSLHT